MECRTNCNVRDVDEAFIYVAEFEYVETKLTT
jgi:hypothetical protein